MHAGPAPAQKMANITLVVLFFLVLWLPLARHLLGPKTEPRLDENRRLAALPELKLKREVLTHFPAKFEAYFNDQFGFRDLLIGWLNRLKVRALRLSTAPEVIIGKHGWLFHACEAPGNDYRTSRPLTAEQLARFQELIEARRDWLASQGIVYVFIIAPEKQTIYPEFLPRVLAGRNTGSHLDQLLAYLGTHSDIRILDVRELLREAKARERVFCRVDSHWNDRGAFVAYEQIMEVLADRFPELKPLPRSAFASFSELRPGDLARMLGQTERMREEWLGLRPRQPRRAMPTDPGADLAKGRIPPDMQPFASELPGSQLPRAVMFRDSFTTALVPFLSEHFSRIVYWHLSFDTDLVKREHPDIVLEEWAERRLPLPLPKNPPEVRRYYERRQPAGMIASHQIEEQRRTGNGE